MLITNDENKKISRNRKRRKERNVNMKNELSSILNEIKTEKKKKNKNLKI